MVPPRHIDPVKLLGCILGIMLIFQNKGTMGFAVRIYRSIVHQVSSQPFTG